ASLGIGPHGQHTEFTLGDFSAVANCTDGDNARPAAIREECRHISAHKCAGDLFATINDQHAAVSRLFHEFFEQLVIFIDPHGFCRPGGVFDAADDFTTKWQGVELFAEFAVGVCGTSSHDYCPSGAVERMEGTTPPSTSNCASLSVSMAAVVS